MFPCVALVLLHYVDVTSYGQVWHRDYALALEQAKAAHKPLAVFIGAKSAGMRTAMINRRDRPFEETPHQPDITIPSMKDLADAIV